METAAPWKPWKTNCMFSTVPTALGKLDKKHRAEFPTVPTASTAGYCFEEKKETTPARRPNQNRLDKMQLKA